MANERGDMSLARWNNATMIAPAQEQAIVGALKGYAKRIASLIGDQGIDVNQLMASVVLAVAKNDYLLKCDPTSLILAVLQGAREGITSYSGPYAGGYLVPFKGKVTLIHNYKFLLDVALESGAVQGVSWGVVREGDDFDYQDGTSPVLTYRRKVKGGRGELVCSWAVVTLPSGAKRIDVCEYEYLTRIANDALAKIEREDAKQYSPWMQWPDEMFTKTQIRHALKTCGLNFDRHNRLVNIMENDDRAMAGEVAREFEGLMLPEPKPKPAGAMASLTSMARTAVDHRDEPDFRDDASDPFAPLDAELSQAPTPEAAIAIQQRWVADSEESVHGEIRRRTTNRIKALTGK